MRHWPSKIERLNLVQADVLQAEAVSSVMQGQDGVLCTLGAGAAGKVRALGTRQIVQAMAKHGVRRLICQSTLGVGDSRDNLNIFWKYLMFGLILRRAYADHVEQEAIVRASNLDWTIVRPSAFTDDERGSDVQQGFTASKRDLKLEVSRLDVASFMLEQLTSTQYLRDAVSLSR